MRRLLTGARVFTGDRIVDGHDVLIDRGRITAVLPTARANAHADRDLSVEHLPAGTLLAPGFVDVQVNGAGGVLFNDTPTAEAALAIAAVMRRAGTTGVLPTLMTDARSKMRPACEAAAQALARRGGGVLGIHLEGPFLNPERAGVHAREWMRSPDEEDIELLADVAERRFGDTGRLLLTLAPECVGDGVLARLSASRVVLAAGHTAATFERTRDAIAAGVRGFTHLFNAMPPIQSRRPGPVAAALADPRSWCSVIVDGIHVHPDLVRLLLRTRPTGRVFLITDAMPPGGTDATSFRLFGRTIVREGGRLTTDDGTLAGADIDMVGAVRNCIKLLDLPLEESLRMASLYPAAYLGLDGELGRIAPSYRADLTLLGSDLGVLATWVDGEAEWHDERSRPTGPTQPDLSHAFPGG